MNSNKKSHWETVYKTKNPEQVSWTQAVPQTSLDLIKSFRLHKNTKIISQHDSNLLHSKKQGLSSICRLHICLNLPSDQ